MRKLLTLALSILMVLTLIPVAGISAFAASGTADYYYFVHFVTPFSGLF